MKKLDHQHLVQLYLIDDTDDDVMNDHVTDHHDTEHKLYLVMEYAAGGTLLQFLEDSPNKRMPEPHACEKFRQILLGIYYLHHNGMIHRYIQFQFIHHHKFFVH